MMNIPLTSLIDIKGVTETAKVAEQQKWLDQYNLFMKCKNLGVKFGPKDLTYEQVEMFHIISETISKQELKTKGNNNK